ncbi:division/cell wall cluster transcriptional repressor MraZ [bacterium]|nr:division/cell wall cluster transcriptional repressor MraZ [bacterium]MCI0566025.1 division/cell wall cluster transcriptional repressor MraZ [bacterium]
MGLIPHNTAMLVGEYIHVFDSKNRISLPAKFRKEMGGKVIITYGLDRCLFVYPLSQWKKVTEKLSELSIGNKDTRSFIRLLLAGATEADIDSVGRMLIPETLKSFAHIEARAVAIGVHTRVELWGEEAWNEYRSGAEKDADVLAEKLGEIGLL